MASINGSTPLHLSTSGLTGQAPPPRNGPAMAHAGNTGCMPGFKAIPRRLAQAIAGLCRGRQTHAPQSGNASGTASPRRSSEGQRLDATLAGTSQQSENIELPVFTTLEPNPLSEEILAVKNTVSTDQASLKDEVIGKGSPKRLSAQSTPPDDGKGATAGAADNRSASTTSLLSRRNSGLRLPQAQEDKGKGTADSKAAPTPPGPEANDARDPLHALDTGIDKVARSLDSFADNSLQQIDDFGENLQSAGNEIGAALDGVGNSLARLGNTMDHFEGTVDHFEGTVDRFGDTVDRVGKSLVDLNQQLKDAAQSLKRGNEEMKARFQAAEDSPVEMTPELTKIVESADAFIAKQKAMQERLLARQRNRQQLPATPDASTSNRTSAAEPKPKDAEKPATPPTE